MCPFGLVSAWLSMHDGGCLCTPRTVFLIFLPQMAPLLAHETPAHPYGPTAIGVLLGLGLVAVTALATVGKSANTVLYTAPAAVQPTVGHVQRAMAVAPQLHQRVYASTSDVNQASATYTGLQMPSDALQEAVQAPAASSSFFTDLLLVPLAAGFAALTGALVARRMNRNSYFAPDPQDWNMAAAVGFGAPKPNKEKKIKEKKIKEAEQPCPCGSGNKYKDCCQPYHQYKADPLTPALLMKARYSAFVNKKQDFLFKTTDLEFLKIENKTENQLRDDLNLSCTNLVYEKVFLPVRWMY